jgi:hypothetical protein
MGASTCKSESSAGENVVSAFRGPRDGSLLERPVQPPILRPLVPHLHRVRAHTQDI